jgi:S-adenosylmethionine hydrolase
MARKKTLQKRWAHAASGTMALLTDFGLQDQYVAAMKAVILSLNPKIHIVDISHQVRPQHVRQAAYLLWSVYRHFPPSTVFVNVVDPGVGSSRAILIATTNKFTFLAPDNGLLDFALCEENAVQIVELSPEKAKKYFLNTVTPTFHGRDIFAPLAAHIAKGVKIEALGARRKSPEIAAPFIRSKLETSSPCILNIDFFGNIVTNLMAKDAECGARDVQAVSVGGNLVSRWIRFYNEAPPRTPCLLIGSSGLVEISIKESSAAHLLNAGFDTPLKIYWR